MRSFEEVLNISSIEFDLSDWEMSAEQDDTHKQWENVDMDGLSLVFFPDPDPSPVDLNNRDSVGQFALALASERGADLVEVDAIDLAGIRCLRVIFKYPQEPTGFVFTGGYSFKVAGVGLQRYVSMP